MLKTYFRVAWRHLLKNKGYSAINIVGLATGMAIALVIGLWITDELSFDHYHKNHSRIAQAMITQTSPEWTYTGPTVTMPLGKAFRDQYKDLFSKVALACDGSTHLITAGDKKLTAPTLWAENELTEMFTFKILAGTLASQKDPSTALISASLARALFGNDDPVNRIFKYDGRLEIKIGGVYEDLPENTTFEGIQVVMPWHNPDNGYHANNTTWNDHNGQLYVQLADHITAEQATQRVKNVPTPHIKELKEEAVIHPLDKAHLYNEFTNGKATGGRIQFVWLFGIIGMSVLLLACINFMNLSTARSEKRAKEVGIRKTMGSLKQQLVIQFLSESILLATLAFIVSLVLVEISLPFFNSIAAKEMSLPWQNGLFWSLAAGFILFTGFLAGSYPAFYLSHFDPVKVLKGTFRLGRLAGLPRKILVVLQFSVSLILIIGTIIVFRQIQYAKDQPVGYDRTGLVTVDMNTPEIHAHFKSLSDELLQQHLVASIATSNMKVTGFESGNDLDWRGKPPGPETIFFHNVNVSREFGRTIGWHVLQGRDFKSDFATDSSSIILNEASAKAIGIPRPVGETVKFYGRPYTVIGVVNNMITNSPYRDIEPAIFLGDGYVSAITMRLNPGRSVHAALDALAPVFKKYNPGSPFEYQFMDDEYQHKFETEERIGNLASVFTSLAIFISCLGLFGLASFVAEQRTKEIGVRKVLGARIITLWSLLSIDFFRLVVISFFVSMPISYLLMNKWLQSYPHHTGLSWWIFALAGAGTLVVTLLTVSYQSLKAATMNPVKSLRSE
jgi:ABC-type antimicrobial peptide transport system permease subunit